MTATEIQKTLTISEIKSKRKLLTQAEKQARKKEKKTPQEWDNIVKLNEERLDTEKKEVVMKNDIYLEKLRDKQLKKKLR